MSRNRRWRERQRLLEDLEPQLRDSAPWTANELDLISALLVSKTRKKFFSSHSKGYIQSIYGEVMMADAARIYSSRQYVLAFAHNSGNYCAMALGNKTLIYHNENLIGELKGSQLMAGNKCIAEIKSSDLGRRTYFVHDEELAERKTSRSEEKKVIDRMFEMVMEANIKGENIELLTAMIGVDVIHEYLNR